MRHFQESIKAHLDAYAQQDPLFAKSLENKDKSLDMCCQYILNRVKEMAQSSNSPSGIGLCDEEVYKIARHYYDEDIDPNTIENIQMGVVVNRHVELTQEDKDKIKQEAIEQLIQEEKSKLRAKSSHRQSLKPTQKENSPTLF
jgi:phosphate uptake regulator